MLQMKNLKAVTWCPTRMGYLLTSSKRSIDLLVPLADVLVSCEIKKELTAYFLSPKCLPIMHTLADVDEIFMKGFIRRLDTDKACIIDVFQESSKAISALNTMDSKMFDSFFNGLSEDDMGHINLAM